MTLSYSLQNLPNLETIRTEKYRRTFREYVTPAWQILEPSTIFLPNWHIDCIAEYLQAVTQGDITRLIVNIPPRYMKSILISVMWPTWAWIDKPHLRWLFASYSASLSTKHSLDRRQIIQSDWYQSRWGDRYKLSGDQNIKTEYQNSARGHMIATSVGGTATGKGGDIVVVDDPHNPQQAESDVERKKALTFFDRSLYNRLDNKKTGAIVIVMQRLHEDDLTGHVLAEQKSEYTHLCLPIEAPKRTQIWMPISKVFKVREENELLWPDREGPKEIEQTKKAMGSYGFAGQYEQNPAPEGGGILQKTWWRHYLTAPDPKEFHQALISVDCAFKELQTSDYTVMQAWGRIGANKYLLDQIKGKWTFPQMLAFFEAFCKKHSYARLKLIEDKANGSAVIQTLRDKIPGIVPVEPQGGKVARAYAISPDVEAGNVFLPNKELTPWVDDFILECAQFPNAIHDDQVDAMTQALTRLGQPDFVPWTGYVEGI